jgi:hypothetical protein
LDDNWKIPVIELLETKTFSSNGLQGVFLLIKYLMEKRLDLGKSTSKGMIKSPHRAQGAN